MDGEHGSIEGKVFTEFSEIKTSAGTKRFLKFFLHEAGEGGGRYLAATGEDQGDAHYVYTNTKLFARYGAISCHNRKELIMWLEKVVKESGGADGPGGRDGVHIDTTEADPEGLYFVANTSERAYFPDGRRCNRWFLIDQRGGRHLAVVGIERDTKDGHYSYAAEEPFSSLMPLACSNQGGVFKWLEKMLTHHAAAAAVSASSGGGGASSAGGALAGVTLLTHEPAERRVGRPLVLSLGGGANARRKSAGEGKKAKSKGGGGGGGGGASKAGGKHAAGGGGGAAQQQQAKRLKKLQEEAVAEEGAARAAQIARLRGAAAAEAGELAAARTSALRWAAAAPAGDEAAVLRAWHDALVEARPQPQQQPPQQQQPEASTGRGGRGAAAAKAAVAAAAAAAASKAASASAAPPSDPEAAAKHARHVASHRPRIAVEALKELGSMFVTARLLLGSKVTATVREFTCDPHPAVADLARRVLQHWRALLAGGGAVLGGREWLADPGAELERRLAAGAVPLPSLPKARLALDAMRSGGSGPLPGSKAAQTPAAARAGAPTPGGPLAVALHAPPASAPAQLGGGGGLVGAATPAIGGGGGVAPMDVDTPGGGGA